MSLQDKIDNALDREVKYWAVDIPTRTNLPGLSIYLKEVDNG